MSKNQQALYNALLLYHELRWLCYSEASPIVAADKAAASAACATAYTDLMTAIAAYVANPEK